MSYLEITEDWIKDRVKITKEKLDDIKSLALPGTYDEKIFRLGDSLQHFSRLKELDLSRNCLETINGLEHLTCLENLNLYYNNIISLKELYRLRHNYKLTQLDLRLNPVARNEVDYRLCLVHMLPLLLRLDDRCVKDQERKAALMYFSSDQAHEYHSDNNTGSRYTSSTTTHTVTTQKSPAATLITTPNTKSGSTNKKSIHPRVDIVNRWTKGIVNHKARLQSNSDEVDDSEEQPDDVYNDYRSITPVSKMINSRDVRCMEEYSAKDTLYQKRLEVERELHKQQQNKKEELAKTGKHHQRSSNYAIIGKIEHIAGNNKSPGRSYISDETLNIPNNYDNKCHVVTYTNSKPPINANYEQVNKQPCAQMINQYPIKSMQHSNTTFFNEHNNAKLDIQQQQQQHDSSTNTTTIELQQLPTNITDHICDLIDKLWTGPRSLHRHSKFLNGLNQILNSHLSQVDRLKKIKEENSFLTEKLKDITSGEVEKFNSLDEIYRSNMILKDQIRDLNKRLQLAEKMSEVTDLLKQSHDSLIITNEELRKQLTNQNTARFTKPNQKSFIQNNGCY